MAFFTSFAHLASVIRMCSYIYCTTLCNTKINLAKLATLLHTYIQFTTMNIMFTYGNSYCTWEWYGSSGNDQLCVEISGILGRQNDSGNKTWKRK